MAEKKCEVCKSNYEPYGRAHQKYCSPKCRSRANYLRRKEKIKQKYEERKALGLCVSCGKKTQGFIYCEKCAEKKRAYYKTWSENERQRTKGN